ncbi:MAG TPA: alpha/beta fold hydrolase [Vicinamibacteria bacterium]|nr:alpha/beta fold hydrolase [Vicinamibacteria bacterium]
MGAAPAPRRKGRWWKRILLLLFLAAMVFLFGVVPYTLGGIATRRRFNLPDRENTEYVKSSFTVAREDITLQTADGIAISGWWIPVDHPRGTVVLVHGLNRTRIEMAKKVEPLHAWGFNCILIDLRHHGASGGDRSTFGLTEKLDVRAAVDFALSKSPGPIVLWGVSLGGATVTLAAADDPRVAGLITDSSYDTLPNTVRHHLRLFRGFRFYGVPALKLVPQWPTSALVLFWIKERGGFDPAEVDVLSAAAKVNGRPSLFVANRGDARIPYAIAEEMTKLAGPKSHMILTESKSHGGAWRDARDIYEPEVKKLLDEVAPPLAAAPASKVEPKALDAAQPVSERTSK